MKDLTHFNTEGRAHMVNVGGKNITERTAAARGKVCLNKQTFDAVLAGALKKGDVLAVAQVAGIMACKRTSSLIPMCHPLPITGADISFFPNKDTLTIEIEAIVSCTGMTGVEMEALTAVSAAALTIYDMCKSMQKDIRITDIRLARKTGGKNGDYLMEE